MPVPLTHTRRPVGQRAEILRNIRDQLPVAKYLELLHCLATTGTLPIYEPSATGKHTPTGEFTEPDRRAQRETLTYLTETALAPLKADKTPIEAPTMDAAAFITSSRNLSLMDLMHGAKGIAPPATTDPTDPTDTDATDSPTNG